MMDGATSGQVYPQHVAKRLKLDESLSPSPGVVLQDSSSSPLQVASVTSNTSSSVSMMPPSPAPPPPPPAPPPHPTYPIHMLSSPSPSPPVSATPVVVASPASPSMSSSTAITVTAEEMLSSVEALSHIKGPIKCPYCATVLARHCTLRRHIDSKHMHKRLRCKICQGSVKWRQDFNKHMKTHGIMSEFKKYMEEIVEEVPTKPVTTEKWMQRKSNFAKPATIGDVNEPSASSSPPRASSPADSSSREAVAVGSSPAPMSTTVDASAGVIPGSFATSGIPQQQQQLIYSPMTKDGAQQQAVIFGYQPASASGASATTNAATAPVGFQMPLQYFPMQNFIPTAPFPSAAPTTSQSVPPTTGQTILYQCGLCLATFPSREDFDRHAAAVHSSSVAANAGAASSGVTASTTPSAAGSATSTSSNVNAASSSPAAPPVSVSSAISTNLQDATAATVAPLKPNQPQPNNGKNTVIGTATDGDPLNSDSGGIQQFSTTRPSTTTFVTSTSTTSAIVSNYVSQVPSSSSAAPKLPVANFPSQQQPIYAAAVGSQLQTTYYVPTLPTQSQHPALQLQQPPTTSSMATTPSTPSISAATTVSLPAPLTPSTPYSSEKLDNHAAAASEGDGSSTETTGEGGAEYVSRFTTIDWSNCLGLVSTPVASESPQNPGAGGGGGGGTHHTPNHAGVPITPVAHTTPVACRTPVHQQRISASGNALFQSPVSNQNAHLQQVVRASPTVSVASTSILNKGTPSTRGTPSGAVANKCSRCARTFTNKRSLIMHFKAQHTERRIFCNLCDQDFKYNSSCTYHLRKQHDIHDNFGEYKRTEGDSNCDDEEMMFDNDSSFVDEDSSSSLLRYPRATSPYSERSCASPASSGFDVEEEEEMIECRECGTNHRKESRQCHHCQRTFKCTSQWENHLWEMHRSSSQSFLSTSISPSTVAIPSSSSSSSSSHQSCSLCSMPFACQDSLRLHRQRSHSLFDCHVCGNYFTNQSLLDAHSQNVHRKLLEKSVQKKSQSDGNSALPTSCSSSSSSRIPPPFPSSSLSTSASTVDSTGLTIFSPAAMTTPTLESSSAAAVVDVEDAIRFSFRFDEMPPMTPMDSLNPAVQEDAATPAASAVTAATATPSKSNVNATAESPMKKSAAGQQLAGGRAAGGIVTSTITSTLRSSTATASVTTTTTTMTTNVTPSMQQQQQPTLGSWMTFPMLMTSPPQVLGGSPASAVHPQMLAASHPQILASVAGAAHQPQLLAGAPQPQMIASAAPQPQMIASAAPQQPQILASASPQQPQMLSAAPSLLVPPMNYPPPPQLPPAPSAPMMSQALIPTATSHTSIATSSTTTTSPSSGSSTITTVAGESYNGGVTTTVSSNGAAASSSGNARVGAEETSNTGNAGLTIVAPTPLQQFMSPPNVIGVNASVSVAAASPWTTALFSPTGSAFVAPPPTTAPPSSSSSSSDAALSGAAAVGASTGAAPPASWILVGGGGTFQPLQSIPTPAPPPPPSNPASQPTSTSEEMSTTSSSEADALAAPKSPVDLIAAAFQSAESSDGDIDAELAEMMMMHAGEFGDLDGGEVGVSGGGGGLTECEEGVLADQTLDSVIEVDEATVSSTPASSTTTSSSTTPRHHNTGNRKGRGGKSKNNKNNKDNKDNNNSASAVNANNSNDSGAGGINNKDKGHFPCDQCNKVYQYRTTLKLHVDFVHEKKGFTCELCNKIFARADFLREHEEEVHQKMKYPCDLCGEVFDRKRIWRTHFPNVHNLTPKQALAKMAELKRQIDQR